MTEEAHDEICKFQLKEVSATPSCTVTVIIYAGCKNNTN